MKSIRALYEKHRQLKLSIFLDINDFQRLFSKMSKSTSDYIFRKLVSFEQFLKDSKDQDTTTALNQDEDQNKVQKFQDTQSKDLKKKLCFYELLAGMIMMSYSEEHNKVRMLYVLFDFDNYQFLDKDEFVLLIMLTLEAWGRFTQTQYTSRHDLERVGKTIFSTRDGRISIIEVAEWLDLNKPFQQLMKSMNPTVQVHERTGTYLPLNKPKEHLIALSEIYLNKRITHSMNNYENLPSIQNQSKVPLKKDFDFQKQISRLGDSNYLLERSIINNTNNGNALKLKSMGKSESLPFLKIPNQKEQQPVNLFQKKKSRPPSIQRIIKDPSPIKNIQITDEDDAEFFKLTNIDFLEPPQTFRDRLIQNNQLNLDIPTEKTKRVKFGGQKNDFGSFVSQSQNSPRLRFTHSTFKNILTIVRFQYYVTKYKLQKGKTYSKQDILTFRKYFEKVNVSQTGYFSQQEYQQSIQDSELMKRLALSLYTFLDKDGDNKVSFEQLLYRTIPGMTNVHYKIFQKWINDEIIKEQKCMVNYKDQNSQRYDTNHAKELNFTQIKDFLYIFTQLDKNNDGMLSLDEVKGAFSGAFTPQQMEQYFQEYDKNNSRLLNIEEFLGMMSPRDHVITRNLMENQVASYVKKRTMGKVNVVKNLINKRQSAQL
ncbi:ef hand family protein [Stylonychia lemnae]|uniref:Ef hand family protein n=1 Tax=Stylonychia lemnae TaxID=5949 RepID=A0A078A0L1_STYLE|nr:ef hand family protein [Stylonychia lemnae]|eukprot:CDW75685.1 ef hand family protein [Stylonychia lemnae]